MTSCRLYCQQTRSKWEPCQPTANPQTSRAILYRHFDSKTDLCRAVLDRARTRLADAVGTANFTAASIDALVGTAAEDPDGFRQPDRAQAAERIGQALDGIIRAAQPLTR